MYYNIKVGHLLSERGFDPHSTPQFQGPYYLTVVVPEIWNILEMQKKCAHIFEVLITFYDYFSLNFNNQLKKVRVSQNSSIYFGLDFGLM